MNKKEIIHENLDMAEDHFHVDIFQDGTRINVALHSEKARIALAFALVKFLTEATWLLDHMNNTFDLIKNDKEFRRRFMDADITLDPFNAILHRKK